MTALVINWTDIFLATADFFEWIFRGMRVLSQGPNVIIWLLIIGGIAYWTMRLNRYRKQSNRQSTLE